MALNYLNNIDLHFNEIQNVLLQNLPGPSDGIKGGIFFNTSNNRIEYFGTSWQDVANLTDVNNKFNSLFDIGDNGDKKINQKYLPSYVDDVLEFKTKAEFPVTGEGGKIYVDTTTNRTYRWSGTIYVEISESLALGYTSSTAFYGNEGYQLKTFFKGSETSSKVWDYALKEGKGVAYYAEKDAVGNIISSTYLNKGLNASSADTQIIYNPVKFVKRSVFDSGIQLGNAHTITSDVNGILVNSGATFNGVGNFHGLLVDSNSYFNNSINLGTKSDSVVLSYVNNILSINKNLKITGSVTATGDATINNNLIVSKNTKTNTLEVSGNSTLNGLVAGITRLNSLTVTGNTILGDAATDTITIQGKSTFAAEAAFNARAKFKGSTGIQIGENINEQDPLKSGGSYIVWDNEAHSLKIIGNVYATGQISAGGIGSGASDNTNVERLDEWNNHNPAGSQVLSANLGVQLKNYVGLNSNDAPNTSYQGKSLTDRIKKIEDNGATQISTSGNGNVITAVSKQNNSNTITFYKDLTVARIVKGVITPGSAGRVIFNHNLNTNNVTVTLYRNGNQASAGEQVFADVTSSDLNSVTIDFGRGISAGDTFRIIVLG